MIKIKSNKLKNTNFIVSNENDLLDFLKKHKYSSNQIKKMLLEKKILVNNEIVTNLYFQLKINDQLVIITNNDNQLIDDSIYNQIKIEYEDEHLFIFFKPSGLLTIPSIYNEPITLLNYLAQKYKYLSNVDRCGIAHRLDKFTAGLIIVAKNNDVLLKLKNMFINNQIKKKYYALVLNHFKDFKKYSISSQIGRKNDNSLKFTTINPKNPKPALTYFKLIKNLDNNISFIDVELITGRTHQIRVHMSSINHPILNDPIYSNVSTSDGYEQYLYSYYLKFNHPCTYLNIELKIDLDEIFKNKLRSINYE